MLGRVQVPRPPGAQSSREVRAPVPPDTSRPGQWVRGLGAKGQGVRGIISLLYLNLGSILSEWQRMKMKTIEREIRASRT